MKWLCLLLVLAVTAFVVWKTGFLDQFLKPWAGWAKWIGYFQ